MKKETPKQEKIDAYDRMIEGARKGGRAKKHFTPESKQRQIEGTKKGGQNSWKHRDEDNVQEE